MRKNWIDIAKGIAILLVCVGHSRVVENKVACSLIYAFHMPFFFMIAGYCYDARRYQTYREYVVRKIKALAWPYFALTFAVAIVATLLRVSPGRNEFVYRCICPYPGCHMIGFWFIRVLFAVELLYALGKGSVFFLAIALSLGVGGVFCLHYGWQCGELILGTTMLALGFYSIGHLISKMEIPETMKVHPVAGAIVICICYVLLLLVFDWPDSVFKCFRGVKEYAVLVVCGMLGSLLLVFTAKILDGVKGLRDSFGWIGRHSLLLLAFHPICGVARHVWVGRNPAFGGYVSYIAELLVLSFLMYLFSGPLVIFLRFPKIRKKVA